METLKKKYVSERTSRDHRNCCHNRKTRARSAHVFHCALKTLVKDGAVERLFICDSEWATRCPEFTARYDETLATKEFYGIVSNPSACGRCFPHLAALLWVLNDEKPQHEDIKQEEKESSWVRKLFSVIGLR